MLNAATAPPRGGWQVWAMVAPDCFPSGSSPRDLAWGPSSLLRGLADVSGAALGVATFRKGV